MKANVIFISIVCAFALTCQASANVHSSEEDSDNVNLTVREILDKYYYGTRDGKNLVIGCAPRGNAVPANDEVVSVNHEFSHIVPHNQFKQTAVHPQDGVWNWKAADDWVESARKNGQTIRMHGPISPQCSQWAREDDRQPEEMEKNLREYMTELCRRYDKCSDVIKWMDVINETIVIKDMVDKKDGQLKYTIGDWVGPMTGTAQFENPWTIIGFDESTPLRVPLYIKYAFEIATREAPHLKHIINQHGQFEEEAWERMKQLVMYLREHDYKVDGVGWQAHVYPEWDKIPGNVERLAAFIDWCHANDLEFHITEINIWGDPEYLADKEGQADTFEAIARTVVQKRHSGAVGINFWYMRTIEKNVGRVKITPWDSDGTPFPAAQRLKKMLIEESFK